MRQVTHKQTRDGLPVQAPGPTWAAEGEGRRAKPWCCHLSGDPKRVTDSVLLPIKWGPCHLPPRGAVEMKSSSEWKGPWQLRSWAARGVLPGSGQHAAPSPQAHVATHAGPETAHTRPLREAEGPGPAACPMGCAGRGSPVPAGAGLASQRGALSQCPLLLPCPAMDPSEASCSQTACQHLLPENSAWTKPLLRSHLVGLQRRAQKLPSGLHRGTRARVG